MRHIQFIVAGAAVFSAMMVVAGLLVWGLQAAPLATGFVLGAPFVLIACYGLGRTFFPEIGNQRKKP